MERGARKTWLVEEEGHHFLQRGTCTWARPRLERYLGSDGKGVKLWLSRIHMELSMKSSGEKGTLGIPAIAHI